MKIKRLKTRVKVLLSVVMKNYKYRKQFIKCSVCGKITGGRLPREGKHTGDGTFWFPRRHKVNGEDCKGNIEQGIEVD